MPSSKSDISNHTIRIFLQKVGRFYDEIRGLTPFSKSKGNKISLLESFNYQCCFCNIQINENSISLDHLIAINKEDLGLNAWGNIVPACSDCNKSKHNKNWNDHIMSLPNLTYEEKQTNIDRLSNYCNTMNYNPNLELNDIANNLYEDVGAVAQALIELRFRQAEEKINRIMLE